MHIKKIINFVLNALYPPYCIVCQVLVQPGHVVCERCVPTIKAVPPLRCRLGKKRQLVVHAVSGYQPPLDRLVRAKEYRQQGAATLLGQLLAQRMVLRQQQYDLLLPVPQHWMRYAWRGYNQSAVIAQEVACKVGIPMVQPFARRRHTPFQRGLDKAARMLNMAQAFCARWGWRSVHLSRLFAGRRVLLVDDVYTTGATVQALAQQVWQYRPALVHAAVACRVL